MEQNTDSTSVTIPSDGRTRVRHGQQAYDLPVYPTLAAWEARAAHLRRRVLVSAGLWPTPERCPLHPQVTGRIEHEEYTIENIYFQSWPGFYVCGNLYRPQGREGPFPGVLCPHGHWAHGRLEDGERGSIPARCISFARQGYVALAYDMIGYNDSGVQLAGYAAELGDGGPDEGPHKRHFHSSRHFLWGISLLGLQLWNSVCALDYLASLPDVDAARLACTGASGGGTQTFLLCAVDERVQVAAPVNMVSAHFQGGCVCENAPGLRLDCTNVEFAAMMAPRPLLMVSATGDWTVHTPRVEYPAVRAVYRLYGAEDRVTTVQVDAPHNYNLESREAVYAWFGRWLLGQEDTEAFKERPYQVDPPERMRVFSSGARHSEERAEATPPRNEESLAAKPETDGSRDSSLPEPALRPTLRWGAEGVAQNDRSRGGAQSDNSREGSIALLAEAATPDQLTDYLIGRAGVQIESLAPRDAATLHAYRETMGVAYRHALNAQQPHAPDLQVESVGAEEREGYRLERLVLGRAKVGERTPGLLFLPPEAAGAALVVHPEGKGALVEDEGPGPLVTGLLERRLMVLAIDAFGSGELAPMQRERSVPHFLTFNLPDTALRVQDVLNGIAYLRTRTYAVHLVGLGMAGLWCLLARGLAAGVARTVIDGARFTCDDDAAWVERLFVPQVRRAGDFRTAAALAAPGRLFVHNAAPSFPAPWFRQVYGAAGAPGAVRVQAEEADVTSILNWVTGG